MEKIPPRLAILEAAVALALEQGHIQRDDKRRESEEWTSIVLRRQQFYAYLREHNIDTKLVDQKVMSIPKDCYGPINPVPPAEPTMAEIVELQAPVIENQHLNIAMTEAA